MRAVLIITAASITEHARRRTIAFFVILSAVMTIGLLYYVQQKGSSIIVFNSRATVAELTSTGFLTVFTLFVAIAVSMGNVGQPFSNGEAAAVLARPVSRWQYVLGRMLASIVVTWGMCILLALETQAVAFAGGGASSMLVQHWAIDALNLTLLISASTLFSSMISTPILAGVAAFILNQLMASFDSLYVLMRASRVSGFVLQLAKWLSQGAPQYVLSNLQLRQIRQSFGVIPDATELTIPRPGISSYFLLAFYFALFTALSFWVANRKEV